MRVKTWIISWELLRDLLTPGEHPAHSYKVVRDAIPPDAELVNVRHAWPNRIEIVLHSSKFEDVPLGSPVPALETVCETIQDLEVSDEDLDDRRRA